MHSFRSLNRDCPICSGVRRDCRKNTQTSLIHCRHDVIGAPPGYRFIGVDALGFNMWAVDDGRGRDLSEWEAQRRARAAERERRLAASSERYAQSLDASERDRNIRRIHAQIGLTTRHRQDLRDRGLQDAQIETGKFFSIAPWQEVSGINSRLAGVDLYGRKLLIGQSGFACPVWDVQGRIVGWQTRFDDATDNKYKWPTSQNKNRPSGATAHLQNGELPITCCRPVDGVKRTDIGLAEGFLKTYVAAQLRGQIVLGASGANFASSPEQTKANLAALSAELGSDIVTLYPDGGAIANNAVMGHYERVIQMVTDWGYTTRIGWWGQVDKSHPDIDELPSDQEISYLTPEEFFRLAGRSSAGGHSFAGLLGWLPRFKRWFSKRRSPWGIGRKGEVENEPSPPQQDPPKYGAGERLDVWQAASHLGYRYILDTSGTGTGKSFDAGLLTEDMFPEARQVIYISADHRNPTTPTLKSWADLEARHSGLYRDEFGKLRRVDKGQPHVVPPNCGRNATIGTLREKNIPGADTADLICRTCPHFEPCRAGAVYGFLNQRAVALKEPRLRAHPASLPSPDDYDYQHTVLAIEEAGEIFKVHRSIEVRADDVSRTIADLMTKLPDAFDALRPALTTLHQYISGQTKQPNKYGWGDAQIRAALPALGDLNLEEMRQALEQHPERLIDSTKEHGVSSADLPRGARGKLAESDKFTAERVATQLALNWLPDFLDVLAGNVVGSLQIQYGVLTVTLPDDRLKKIVDQAGCTILLDATANPLDIARALGIKESEILVTEQVKEKSDNLEIIQVTSLGRLGLSQRSDYCQERVDAVIAQIQKDAPGAAAVLDFKRHTVRGDGKRHWWVDSRGVNDLETCQTLMLVGTPCPNLSALQAEFTVLHGRRPVEGTEQVRYPVLVAGQPSPDLESYFDMEVSADRAFRDFVRQRILAAYRQAIGRLRTHRRPGEKLKVYIVADYPLDFPVKLVRASEITPDAATKVERLEIAIKAAVQQLRDAGQKVTQAAVAAITGYTQQHISRYSFLLISLIDDPIREMSKNGQPPPDPGETEWMSREYLPLLAKSSPAELLEGVLNTFEVYGSAVFRKIWDAAPAQAQSKILQVLLLTLPAGELRSLALAVGVSF